MAENTDSTLAKQEFTDVTFGDERLDQRFNLLVEQLSQSAGHSIPLACEDWAAVKGAYRFFDNPKVNAEKILKSHAQATARRANKLLSGGEKMLLMIQDTTYFNYSRHKKTKGLGHISGFKGARGEKLEAHGLILHSALAMTTDGVPLGIIDGKLWTRTKPAGSITESGKNTSRIPLEEKESFRWIEAMRGVERVIQKPSQVVHVCDRESDIIEFFLEAKHQGTHFVVRIRDCRRHIEGGERIFDPVNKVDSKGFYKIPVCNSNGVKRIAKVEVKFYPVTVLPSVEKKDLESVEAWVISATEVDPPSKEDMIDWKLLTDMSLSSFDDAMEKIGWYTLRWQIEVFHKVLKSGCKVLDCRLQTADRLIRYVALMSVVAWRIFWMTTVTRTARHIKPTIVLTPDEITAIRLYTKRKQNLRTAPELKSANDWIRALAKIGGFLARKADGDPGPFTFWRGYLRLQDIMLGIDLTSKGKRCG